MKIIQKSLVLLIILFSLLGYIYYQNRVVKVCIQSAHGESTSILMPWKDRQSLTRFFYNMMIREEGGYTLFGCKPLHMNGYIKPFSLRLDRTESCGLDRCISTFLMSLNARNVQMARGWKTWGKYAHLMKDSSFHFWAEKNPFWKEPHDAIAIFLVHINKFDEMVRSHSDDFKLVLGKENVTGKDLLTEAKQASLFNTVLKKHEGLIGTSFGFGRNNAWLFERREQGEPVQLSPLWDSKVYEFLCNAPKEMILRDLASVVAYPSFLVDPESEETSQLKEKFLEARQKIIKYYQGKDILEATLSLLLDHRK